MQLRLGWYVRIALVMLVGGVAVVWAALPSPVALPPAWRASAASGPLAGVPVRNFGVVEQGILYRSAQPGTLGMPWLRRYGIKSIVNLREPQYDDGALMLSGLGLNFFQLPIDNYTQPTEAQALAFLDFVQDRRNWPVLVHCAEGKGRTGVLVALTRYAIDGWPLERALAEADSYTTGKALSRVQREWIAEWASAHAPGDRGVAARISEPAEQAPSTSALAR